MKFEINRTKIKGGCQSGRKMVTHNSNSNLPQAEETFEYCRAHLRVRLGGSFIDIFQTPCTFGWHVQLQIPLQPHTHIAQWSVGFHL